LKTGSNIIEFGNLLNRHSKKSNEVQTHWVIAKEIDWENKTMTATGVIDELDWYNILLGLGSSYKRPAIDSKCLIGIVNNNSAAAFLIECEILDEIEISDKTGFKLTLKDGLLTINGEAFGGIVKADELKTQIDKNTEIIKQIQLAFQNWTPIPEDGGAALKALVSGLTGLERADLSGIKNDKVKHG